MSAKVLVTGGAGYIGSHVTRLLLDKGYKVIVVDDLSRGHYQAVDDRAKFYQVNVGDTAEIWRILVTEKPEAVMHFAGYIVVPESVKKPWEYYYNNMNKSIRMLGCLIDMYKSPRAFIFSSSAAVYGVPDIIPIPEKCPTNPINPYGKTKLFFEHVLEDCHRAYGLPYIALRYFNAAGAHPSGEIGEAHEPETHLIPLAVQTALGKREKLLIYGGDYDTPDGTCIRDYIHVMDLAEIHVLAMEYLLDGGESGCMNCGYGKGYSVKEVVDTVKKVTRRDFPVEVVDRRPGDPPILVADVSLMKEKFNFSPEHDDLEKIVFDAFIWERNRKF